MYELKDFVRFRHWSNKHWEDGTWIIIDIISDVYYNEIYYRYDIQNCETGEIQYEVNWQQIEAI